jgi:hypothetical protein
LQGHAEYLDARRDATDHLGLRSAQADDLTAPNISDITNRSLIEGINVISHQPTSI